MAVLKRTVLVVGAVAIVAAVVMAIALRGWEFASWVSAIVGAFSIAGGFAMRANSPGGRDSVSGGDDITITNAKAGRDLIAKETHSDDSNDRIALQDVEAGNDLRAKRIRPATDQ
ncbi:hypothetical protein AB0L88_30060 [Saccharopolyspora shandongensis]|uniref:hypothetical protein n=1 Tax=Saccharopolyspora shandongensis TaxID=418495 RepID=UPI00343F43CB